jgi:hypothetical protein
MARDFGFGGDKKLDVSKFAPRQDDERIADHAGLGDEAAERTGFKSREPMERVARIRKPSQPFDQAFVRAPI